MTYRVGIERYGPDNGISYHDFGDDLAAAKEACRRADPFAFVSLYMTAPGFMPLRVDWESVNSPSRAAAS